MKLEVRVAAKVVCDWGEVPGGGGRSGRREYDGSCPSIRGGMDQRMLRRMCGFLGGPR